MRRDDGEVLGRWRGGFDGLQSLFDDMWVADIMLPEEGLEGRLTGALCLFERRPAAEEVAEQHGVFFLKPLQGIGIILAVLCNTMAMSVRERRREHATLRVLGFGPVRIVGLILGESLAIAVLGGILGVLLSYPAAAVFAAEVGTLFPVFEVSDETAGLAIGCAAAVGVLAALLAAPQAVRVPIVVGLRGMG